MFARQPAVGKMAAPVERDALVPVSHGASDVVVQITEMAAAFEASLSAETLKKCMTDPAWRPG